jgi:hypothetical protein
MVRDKIKSMINGKSYHTIREIRKDWGWVKVSESGMVSLISEGCRVWISKVGGVYKVAAIDEIKKV